MRKSVTVFSLLLSLVFCISCSDTAGETSPFVTVENGNFLLEGEPYYFFGANFWHGAYLGADLVEGDRARLLRELDLLKEHKITNLRVMASSELSTMEMSVKPAFLDGEGNRNERLLEGLDFLLLELGKRDMKAVLVLNNYWQWSGGMIQYMGWETGQAVQDPDQTGDWRTFMFQSAEFYGSKGANQMYRDYIEGLVGRVNTISGVPYVDDPAIMSWQLANEPRPAPDSRDNPEHARLFVQWVHSTCEFIQGLDPNHLVSTGNEGYNGSAQSWEIYREAHESPHVDYLTFHIWPKNWGWYDATDPDATFERALSNTFDYFAEHIDMARQINKPTVLEEFGLERDSGSFSPDTPTTYRDKYLSELFSAVVDSALAGSPMAGLNFWAWGGEARASHEDYLWRVGDSFMGDPPQEPQGLNSVFSSDRSTLEVFRKYNAALEELN